MTSVLHGEQPRPGRRGHQRRRTVHEVSAGGLVVDDVHPRAENPRAVIIGRTGRRGGVIWSLPKGHIEPGETAEQTAVREVAEETGIIGDVLAALGTIHYWFTAENCRVHKTVHHYLLQFRGGELSDGDHEVGHVAWVPLRELPTRLAHADERRLAEIAAELVEVLHTHGLEALPPPPHTTPRRLPQTHSRSRGR